MGRPPLPLGTSGKVLFATLPNGRVKARVKFRDYDGRVRLVSKVGPSRAAAERELKAELTSRQGSGGVGAITSATRMVTVSSVVAPASCNPGVVDVHNQASMTSAEFCIGSCDRARVMILLTSTRRRARPPAEPGGLLMIDDMFVFDCVCHVYDFSPANQRSELREMGPMLEGWRYAMDFMKYDGQQGEFAGDFDWETRFTAEQMYEMEFVQSPVDMAMACAVPVWDWFQDSFSSIQAQHEFASKYPERVLLSGGVDPIHHGLHGAKREMIRQVHELGAVSMKFYNAHVDKSWSCDDKELAYPLYELAGELGVNVLQFHKGLPFGMWDVDKLRPVDLQRPARDFPDLNFVIHHLALPYFDEVVSIASRFPNVHLALSGVLSFYKVAPRQVQEQLGRLLMEVGAHKLMWGSEAAMTGAPAPFLRDFMELEIPEDLRRGYGYPQITRADKELILGGNMARLFNVDIGAKKAELAAASGTPVEVAS